MKTSDKSTLRQALTLAANDLISCFTPHGIVAGRHHYVDLWARDSLFATFGANFVNPNISKTTITSFLSHQRPDGLIPYRLQRSPTTIGKYLGHPRYYSHPRPNFRSHQSGGLILDGNPLVIIAARQYYDSTHDLPFIKRVISQLTLAADWCLDRGQPLLSEWILCEWTDSIMKAGQTLYTNVLFAKSLQDLSYLFRLLSHPVKSSFYHHQFRKVKKQLDSQFWNGRFFADWVDYRRQNYFSSHSNLLAVVLRVATSSQSRKILQYIHAHHLSDWTVTTNHPPYPPWRIWPLNHLFGLPDYHNQGCLWLQTGILYVIALYQSNFPSEAKEILDKISRQIVKHNGIFEVYEKNGIPLHRPLYRAEHPFAWSAGLFLWAASIINPNP